MLVPSRAKEGSPSDLFSVPSVTDPIRTAPIFAKEQIGNILPQPETPLEIARRRYLLAFAQRYPKAWEAWEKGGLIQDESNHNIIEHQVMEGVFGGILASEAGLPESAVTQIEYALLVHDAAKILERDKVEAALLREKGSMRRLGLDKALSTHAALLKKVGIEDTIIHLSEAIVPDNSQNPPEDPRAKIPHFIDAITDGSILKTSRERMKQATTTSGLRRPSAIALDSHHANLLRLSSGDAYREVQIALTQKEAEQLHAMIRAQGVHTDVTPETLPDFLQQRFDEKVRAFAIKNNLPL